MNVRKMIDDYANWLKSEITVARFGEYYELTTPYLDRFNDYFQIYVKQDEDGRISMTDDGYVINNLLSSGMSLRANSKRDIMLRKIISIYSLHLTEDNCITTTATIGNFPQKKHMMVQAMLSIDDMFELNAESIKNFFIEDIAAFFDSNNIYYSRDFSLIGKTGSIYTYDFHFQRTKSKPERFCKGMNRLREDTRNLTIFNWVDTQEKRGDKGKLIVFLNDENPIKGEDMDAFKEYEILPILYSERDKHREIFEAA